MDRFEKILEDNRQLITRFVNLMFCRDHTFDSRRAWFYSLVSEDTIKAILYLTTEEDIRHQLYVFILEQLESYSKSDREFSDYLKKSIGWRLRDITLALTLHHKTLLSIESPVPVLQPEQSIIDLRWALSESSMPLTDYQKYILYLYFYREYDINEICDIVYQERTTVRKELREAKAIFAEHL